MLNKNSRIFLAGHNGMVGSAVLRKLRELNYKKIFFISKKKLDLTDQTKVSNYFKKIKPHGVILAAAKVGGIKANNEQKADFIYENLSIQNNVINSSFQNGVKNLIFLGSSCVYPKKSRIPIKENYLLSNYLEKTNEPYAIAKIAGIKMCESYNNQYKTNYKCLMPCNTYGINDNYNLQTSHFFPALIRKIYQAVKNNKKSIKLWGTGKVKRELMFVDDLADACVYFMNKKTKHFLINIGSEKEKTISGFANFILKKLDSNLNIIFDKNTKIDGTPRKILDCSLARKYGWESKISLDKGFDLTFKDFLEKLMNFK